MGKLRPARSATGTDPTASPVSLFLQGWLFQLDPKPQYMAMLLNLLESTDFLSQLQDLQELYLSF